MTFKTQLTDDKSSIQSTKLLGNVGEETIATMLETKGFCILARNYTIRAGEIDIIAMHNDLVIFVEVKTRTRHTFNLSQAINKSKQRKIILTAKHFLLHNNISSKTYRFDVAFIEGEKISYIPNAFLESKCFF